MGPVGDRNLVHSALFAVTPKSSLLQEIEPDVLIVEAIPFIHLPFLAKFNKSLRSKRILNVCEAWQGYSYFTGLLAGPSAAMVHKLLSAGLSWADRVVAISNITATSLMRHYGVQNVNVFPMGVDFKQIQQIRRGSDGGHKEYDFISLGRLSKVKRHRDILHALARLRDSRGWSGRAAIIGDGPLAQQLQYQIEQLDLGHQVELLRRIDDSGKFELLGRSRVMIHSSEREGFGAACLEGLACGLPVVLAKPSQPEVSGATEIVLNGVNGIHYTVGDIEALTDALDTVQCEDVRQRLSAAAVTLAQKYDWDTIAQDVSRFVSSICAERVGGKV